MDYVQRCFSDATGWDQNMSYEQILRTSDNMLDFAIPSGFKLSVASKNTEYSYSTATLHQLSRISGSLSYIYSSIDLKNTYLGTGVLPLKSVLDDYCFIRSPKQERLWQQNLALSQGVLKNSKPYMLYGKMYFPSQFLEAMVVKRFNANNQLTMKFINTPKLRKMTKNSSMMTLCFQRQNANHSTDFLFYSPESLLGLRCLYKLGSDFSLSSSTGFADSTSLSLGFEMWYALMSMSPGLSTAARYSTHISSSGKPLTMTLALNPLLGTIESTYTIKPGLNSTFASKYKFNIYSYESDLLLGFSLLRCSGYYPPPPAQPKIPEKASTSLHNRGNDTKKRTTHQKKRRQTSQQHQSSQQLQTQPENSQYPFYTMDEEQHHKLLTTFMGITPGKLVTENNARHFIDAFNRSKFTSSFKCAASLAKKDVSISWEGKFQDLILSSGVHIDCNDTVPKVGKYGIEVEYSS